MKSLTLVLLVVLNPHSVMCEPLRFSISPDACRVGIIEADASFDFSELQRNRDYSRCDPQLGLILSPPVDENLLISNPDALLETTRDMSSLHRHYKDTLETSSGISFELWIKMPRDDDGLIAASQESAILLSVGDSGSDVVRGGDPCTAGSHDFRLLLLGMTLQLVYRAGPVGSVNSCRIYSVPVGGVLAPGGILNLMVSLGSSRQSLYLNGENILQWEETFQSDLMHWNPSYKIQIFGNPATQRLSPSHGTTIYGFAMYTEALSDAMVFENFSRGLPPTQPFGLNQSVIVNEDAELHPGSHEPEWYDHERTFDDGYHLPVVALSAKWLDGEVYNLLFTADAADALDPPVPYFYIKYPPEHGKLFQMDGTAIDSAMEQVLYNASVVYIPSKDAYSLPSEEFTNFEYCVSSGKEPKLVECEVATVRIFVQSVSDPPIPDSPKDLFVPEGERISGERVFFGANRVKPVTFNRTSILSGTDPRDPLDTVVKVRISTPPRRGYLVLSPSEQGVYNLVENYRKMTLESLNWMVDAPAVVDYFAYGLNEPVVSGAVANDSFGFQVADQHGTWSKEATVHVQIVTSLFAGNSTRWALLERNRDEVGTPPVVVENTASTFNLRGCDTSKLKRNISYQITSLPTALAGYFVDPSSGSLVEEGSILVMNESFPYGAGVPIEFVPAPGFQNYPCHPWKPSISACGQDLALEYRVVVLNNSGAVVSASVSERQGFLVQNFNSPPTISGAVTIQTLQKTPRMSTVFLPHECLSFHPKYSPDLCPFMTTLKGVEVIDPDHDVDPVMVDLQTRNGVFCLDGRMRHLFVGTVFFPAGGDQNNPWCSRRALFFALPPHISEILSSSIYQSFDFEGRDELTITIRDGSSCFDGVENEHTNGKVFRGHSGIKEGSFHPTCYNVTKVVELVVEPFPGLFTVDAVSLLDFILSDSAVWILVLFFLEWFAILCLWLFRGGGFDGQEHARNFEMARPIICEQMRHEPSPSELVPESDVPEDKRSLLSEDGSILMWGLSDGTVEAYSLSNGQYRYHEILTAE